MIVLLEEWLFLFKETSDFHLLPLSHYSFSFLLVGHGMLVYGKIID